MAIPENQLEAWTRLGSVTQSSQTYQGIKAVLEHQNAPYIGRSIDCFLQGSYCNDTNIYGDSDVDIVLRTRSLFHYNLDALPEPQKLEFKRAHPNAAEYQLPNFREDVVYWLEENYEADLDTGGKKALRLKATSNRRSTDILLVAPHKKYTRYLGDGNPSFLEGVLFITTDGAHVINYPEQHSANLTAKHQASDSWLKPTIRIYKNMRKQMVNHGIIKAQTAPSYFLEGALSNVPPHQFGVSWSDTVQNTFSWIEGNAPADYTCANGIHPLIQDNSSTSWSVQGYIDWLNGMKALWNGW